MWRKLGAVTMVLLSLTSLIVSGRLFFHYKFIAESYSISLMKLIGGEIWLLMELVNLCILGIIFMTLLYKCIIVLKEKTKNNN